MPVFLVDGDPDKRKSSVRGAEWRQKSTKCHEKRVFFKKKPGFMTPDA
jgi:hypothetical protein